MVVDDEEDIELLIRQKFRNQVREKEYEFIYAKNGVEALALLAEHPDLDMVFSDINMPEMDGLTLLKEIRNQNPLIRTVMISAYSDMSNIRQAMNSGAFDFIGKPIDFDDFENTMQKPSSLWRILEIRYKPSKKTASSTSVPKSWPKKTRKLNCC